ncbi:MAG: LicD family protein [Arachnia sp.]
MTDLAEDTPPAHRPRHRRPKVSVIVPVYNSEAYLERCLDSLVNQTLDDIEILVINDGSPDGSQAIIDRYALAHPTLVVPFVKDNGGLSDARNYGVARASGEFLSFVDSDDYVDLDMLQRMYEKATATGADVVASPMTYAWDTRNDKRYFTKALATFDKPVSESPDLLKWANSFACNKIYRRELWVGGGFSFPVGQAFEDSAVIYNVLHAANLVACVNIPFYHYVRYRGESITNTFDRKIFDVFLSCDSILGYYRQQPGYDDMKKTVEYVCLRHIVARMNRLARCDDKELVGDFLSAAYEYMDRMIPDWRESAFFNVASATRPKQVASRWLRGNGTLTKAYYTSPRALRSLPRLLKRTGKKAKRTVAARVAAHRQADRTDAINETKSKRIQADGLQLITVVQRLLARESITCFADFGTLLGLIREGRLLSHDLDIDLGVIANDHLDHDRIRIALERFGFKVWREYHVGGRLVEASFRLMGVKVDLNYYRVDDEGSKAWLLYRDPDKSYGPRERDVVEMSYSPIREMTTITVQGVDIVVPANADELLAEKYGPTWRVPDKGWIYWESPAATKIDDEGSFVTFRYLDGFARAGDSEDEELYEQLYRRALADASDVDDERTQIRQLQLQELSVLKEVDRICRAHGLTYYLGEGTLLGAIRHQGFIPWDDDIDIVMPREDYEAFLRLAPSAIASGFEVQHWTTTPNYWSAFAKVRLLDTSLFYQPPIAHLTPNNGPYIDIFPLDSVPEQRSPEQNRQKRLMTRYRKSLSYKRGDTRPKTFRTKIIRLYSYAVNIPFLYRKLDETYTMLAYPGNEYWVNLASYYPAAKETFHKDMYGTPRYVRFEDGEFPVPQHAEEILETIYGPSYLRMPEIEQRKIKHAMVYRPAEG